MPHYNILGYPFQRGRDTGHTLIDRQFAIDHVRWIHENVDEWRHVERIELLEDGKLILSRTFHNFQE